MTTPTKPADTKTANADPKAKADAAPAETEKAPAEAAPAGTGAAASAGKKDVIIRGAEVVEAAPEEAAAPEARDLSASTDPFERADAAGIGYVKPLGRDAWYVGLSPPREGEDTKGPDGLPIGKFTLTPLRDVAFDLSIQVKDPASGTFYFPPEGCSSWADCNLDGAQLIPDAPAPEPPPEGAAAKANGGDKEDAASDTTAKDAAAATKATEPASGTGKPNK